jgi:hypothetical protein
MVQVCNLVALLRFARAWPLHWAHVDVNNDNGETWSTIFTSIALFAHDVGSRIFSMARGNIRIYSMFVAVSIKCRLVESHKQ